MRSSTSSSRVGPPSGPWILTWAVALAGVALATTLLETQARRLGIRPSWSAGAESWCVEAAVLGSKDIAVIGTSRAVSGIEPVEFSRATGRPVRQLAINASSMLPVLEWLARREDYSGVVIAEIVPGLEFRAGHERHAIAERIVADFPDFNRSPGRRIEAVLARAVQTRVAFKSPGFHLLAPYRDRQGPGVGHLSRMSVEASRFVRLEFHPGDPTAEPKRPERSRAKPADDRERRDLQHRFAEAARAIEKRGGRVVFLFMPMTGQAAEMEERDFPRREYWDRLGTSTRSLKIHFRDHSKLSGFACPDEEHLDGEDAVRFTRALAELLLEKGGL
ncbi:MAG TPA: hypothetical protein VJU16_08695 [Planctomycetota bacterium]|nr:hypothetical protein [Planctomycetota bacterium]